MHEFGYVRITAASPKTSIAAPQQNVSRIIQSIHQHCDSDIVLLPELSITGYTAADLFAHQSLIDAASDGLLEIAQATRDLDVIAAVGVPIHVEGSLYNCAALVQQGRIAGIVPKQFLPTYKEFYEGRWFRAADGHEPSTITLHGQQVPFGVDLLFRSGDLCVGIEICEDLWTPNPPSGSLAIAGANVILNLSASTETIGKASWRRDLVKAQSGRCICAYAYAGAGPTESTTDVVFGGHCLIAENGAILGESERVGGPEMPTVEAQTDNAELTSFTSTDVDIQKLLHDRRVVGSFDDAIATLPRTYRTIQLAESSPSSRTLVRELSPTPFVPSNPVTLNERCSEVFGIQTAGLAKRVSQLPDHASLFIGVSGGLDSTLALVAAVKACDAYGWSRDRIHGITMPGFGTTSETRTAAENLMQQLGVQSESIDIRATCLETFRSLGHQPLGIDVSGLDVESLQQQLLQVADDAKDLVFENVQARVRTMLLMSRGFVLGTGDLSEQALGWSTYNGDHMSMYNVNTSIPKTLVRFLVKHVADHHFSSPTRETLYEISETVISPELLPPSASGEIRQSTEQTIGPYELHDFFLFHFIRNGYSRRKIRWLAGQTEFSQDYCSQQIDRTLGIFFQRFFANQFKRSCVPDGPKVGSVSLSPRGDWRMASDADPGHWSEPR